MNRIEKFVELRWKEYQLRHLGDTALKDLAHELVTPERYAPGPRFIDGAVEMIPAIDSNPVVL